MLFAVFVVAAAASCINVGKALQKEGTKRLPRLVLDARVLGTYARDPTWALGMALDVLGGLLMVLAISLAPVSLVQPVAAGGVAVLAVFSHFRLGERLDAREWAGVALAVVGTVGIGAVAEEEQQDAPPAAEMTKTRVVLGVALVAVMLAAPSRLSRGAAASKASPGGAGGATTGSAGPLNGGGGGGGGGGGKKIVGLVGVGQGIPHHLRHSHLAAHAPAGAIAIGAGSDGGGHAASARAHHHHRGPPSDRAREAIAGARSGVFFSLSATSVKIGFLAGAATGSRLVFPLVGALASVGLTAVGLVCQTRGLKDGNSVVVCTCGNVAQMVSSALFGVLCLGEKLPSTSRGRGAWLASWTAILAGVVMISGLKISEDLHVGDGFGVEALRGKARRAGARVTREVREGLGGVGGLGGSAGCSARRPSRGGGGSSTRA